MRNLLAAGVLCLLASAVTARAQETKLSFAEAPKLVDCDGRPCLWISINRNRTDASGAAMGLPRSPSDYKVVDLRGPIELKVFYVSDMLSTDAVQHRQVYSILLFDLSGSMAKGVADGGGESRFDAAVKVLRDVISTRFTEGVDHWAIVGFESHDVVRRIDRARFASTRHDAVGQLSQLGAPARQNNTALFSAIDTALPMLKEKQQAGNDVRLIVFTDGKNEVLPGDDPGLLTDGMGLRLVTAAVAKNEIEIIPIGFGTRGATDFDEQTLKGLAYPRPSNYHYAANRVDLANAFGSDQDQLAKRVRLSVMLSEKEKNTLTQKIPLRVSLTGLDGAHSVPESEIPFTKKGVQPSWEGEIVGEEKAAYGDTNTPPGSDRLLVKVAIFSGFVVFFVLAWFGLPRLAWPESYIPRPRLPNMPVAPGFQSGVPKAPSFRREAPPPPPSPRPAPRMPMRPDTPSPRQGAAPEEWRPSRAPHDDATRHGTGGAPPQGRGPEAGRQRPPGDAPRRWPSDDPQPRGGGPGPGSDDSRPRGGQGGGGGPAPGRPAGPQPARGGPGAEPPRSADDATVYIPRGKKYEQDT